MRPTPANPFRDFSARRLVDACGHYIKQLRARRPRSVAEREQLTEDLVYLVLGVERTAAPAPIWQSTAERSLHKARAE